NSVIASCIQMFHFYSYGDHGDLHSFPTRRSSDLGTTRAGRVEGDEIILLTFADVGELLASGENWRDRAAVEGPRLALAGAELGRDRKSTRLNSSHLVISYAVFCLKKKNTIQN